MKRYTLLHLHTLIILSLSVQSLPAQGELQIAELGDLELENGRVLDQSRIGYRTMGRLNQDSSNIIIFPTWYTGNSGGIVNLIRNRGLVDTSQYYIVAIDALSDGVSTSPCNRGALQDQLFPEISIHDMVYSQYLLLTRELGINSIHAVMGYSMGGMQAFDWAVTYPTFMKKVISIAGSPRLAYYDILRWETDIWLFQLITQSESQIPAAALYGINVLMGRSPAYHAEFTTREDVPARLERMDSYTVSVETALDRASQARAMINHNVADSFDDDLARAASATSADMLIIVGLTDHVVTPGPALEFARLAQAQTLELTNNCGHAALYCAQQEVSDAISLFLADR